MPLSSGAGSVVAEPSKKQLSAIGSKIVQAYGHPIRARALMILGSRVASPKEISEEIEEPIGKVSYHIRELRDWGLIELVETDNRRGGVQHFYRAHRLAIMDKKGMALLDSAERAESSAIVINLMVSDIAAAVAEGTLDSRVDRALIRHHALVDERGWEALSDLYTESLYRAFEIHRESIVRLEESGEEGIAAAVHALVFEMPETEQAAEQTLEWLDGREADLQGRGGKEGRRADDGGSEG